MKEILMAVDSGKNSTKALCQYNGKRYSTIFRTKVQEAKNVDIDLNSDSFNVHFQGKSYLVGNVVSEDKVSYSITKNTIDHRIAIFTAISHLLKKVKIPQSSNIQLAVNFPISLFKDRLLKDMFKHELLNNGELVLINVNDQLYSFRITKVMVINESIGPIYSRIGEFRRKDSLVIDVGSLNVSFCSYNGVQYDLNSMVSLDKGISTLQNKIAEKLTEKFGTYVTSDDALRIMNNGFLSIRGEKQEKSVEIIQSLTQEHVQDIFNQAIGKGISFNNRDIIFIGGGSIILESLLQKEFPLATFEINPQFSNCESFLTIIGAVHEKETTTNID
ncbi:TPA: ParM/StbA family protein [Salmonella enterica subsp. enterica serovar Typhimurium var. 5-]|uniref:ParM/StbA family protein n=1 Tax=Salmonella enterica subsp. enterica serovar Typhimurium var. 5- TaxID=1620419 RepID=A0A740TVM7_SALTM|nr:ParM/StbA family protein [Salmonella enterica subsp. enterica serovar Typhimurium var. 5-]